MSPPTPKESRNSNLNHSSNELVQASQEFDQSLAGSHIDVQMQSAADDESLQMSVPIGGLFHMAGADTITPVAPDTRTAELQMEEEEPGLQEDLELQTKEFDSGIENHEVVQRSTKEDPDLQPKLTIGKPGDKYEQEADAVADQVVQGMQQPDGQNEQEEEIVQEKIGNRVQTMLQASKFPEVPDVEKELPAMEEPVAGAAPPVEEKQANAEGEKEEATDVPLPEPIQEVEGPEIMAKAESRSFDATAKNSISEGLDQSKGSGSHLPGGVKGQMESGFGTDFSGVKVHTDSNAVQMNRKLGSKAFTNQNDIYFNQGQYNPNSKDGKTLLAHELTHTIQQGAVSNTVQTFVAPEQNVTTEPKATKPNDGNKVENRSDSKIKNDPDFDDDAPTSRSQMDEEDKEKANPNRGEVRKEKSEVASSGVASVDVDRGATAGEKSREQKTQISQTVDSRAKTAEGENKEEKGKEENLSEADSATQRAAACLAQANATPIPTKPETFKQPRIEAPVDKEGQPLPRKSEIDTQVRGLGYMGELFREHGYEIKKSATNKIIYAHGLDSNLETQRADLANAKEGTTKMDEHNTARKEISEGSKKALQDSKERQAFVAEKAPGIAAEAEKGKSESGDLASESAAKAEKAKSEIPDDPDARRDAEKQSGDMNEASEGAATADEAITKAGERAVQYSQEAQLAAGKNTETEGSITETDTILEQTATRIAEMHAKNEESQGKIDQVAAGPEQIRTEAEENILEGDELIRASYVMEIELNDIQQQYLSGMAAIETRTEAEERIKKEQEQGAGQAQLSPEEQELMMMAAMSDEEQQQHVAAIEQSEDGEQQKSRLMAALEKMITTTPDKGTDATEGARLEVKTGLQDKIMGGPPPSDPRMPEIEKVDKAREDRLPAVLDIGDLNIGRLSETEKAMLAQKLTGEAIADDIKNIDILQMGKGMIQGMIDPRMALTGPIDGFDKMATGFANIFNADAWEKDPLGNLLKVAADITTGLAMIFSGVLGIAGMIMALMVAITIASWGFALPFTAPVMGWMGTIMTYAGWGAIIAGSLSVYYNYLCYLKNLHDASTADSARELFGNVEQMKENVSDGFTGAMAIVEGVGAVKMGPAMTKQNFLDTTPRSPGEALRNFTGGVKDTAAAVRALPGAVAQGAKKLFSGGKQGLIKFKDKLKSFFRKGDAPGPGGKIDAPSTPGRMDSAPGTRTNASGSPTSSRSGEVDAPSTNKSDAPTNKRSADADSPSATKKHDADGLENRKIKTDADGDLGSVDGKKVKAEEKLADGHTRKYLVDGQCPVCSICTRPQVKLDELRGSLGDKLNKRIKKGEGTFASRIDELDADLKKLQGELRDTLQTSGVPTTQQRLRARQIEVEIKRLEMEAKVYNSPSGKSTSTSRTNRKDLQDLNEKILENNHKLSDADIDLIYEHFEKRTKYTSKGGNRYRLKADIDELLQDAKAFKFADDIDPGGINPRLPEVYRELKKMDIPDADLETLKKHFKENYSGSYPAKGQTNLSETLENLKSGKKWDKDNRIFVQDPDKPIDFHAEKSTDEFALGEYKSKSTAEGQPHELQIAHEDIKGETVTVPQRNKDGSIARDADGNPIMEEGSFQETYDKLKEVRSQQKGVKSENKDARDAFRGSREELNNVHKLQKEVPNLSKKDSKLLKDLDDARFKLVNSTDSKEAFEEALANFKAKAKALDGADAPEIKASKKGFIEESDKMLENLEGYQSYKKAQKNMIDASEDMGEAATDALIKKSIPGAEELPSKLPGKGKQGQFDKIYVDQDGNVYLIESKGGKSKLGTSEVDVEGVDGVQSYKGKAEQGSEAYKEQMIHNLRKAVADKSLPKSTRRELVKTLRALKNAPEVHYLHVQQLIDGAEDVVSNAKVSKFK